MGVLTPLTSCTFDVVRGHDDLGVDRSREHTDEDGDDDVAHTSVCR